MTKDALNLLLNVYFICGLMDVMAGSLKGLGYSLSPMIISVLCICGTRIVWRYAVFPLEPVNSLMGIYISYPISWLMAFVCFLVLYVIAYVKLKKKHKSIRTESSDSKSETEVLV